MKRAMRPANAKKGRHTFRNDLRKNGIYLLLLLPAVVYVVIFSYIPMGGVIMAFKSYNYTKGLFASPWVGMKNFDFLMVSGKLWPLTRNTLLYNFAFITVGMVMEVGFAIIINEMRCKWFKKIFQSFIFLPYFISWVIASAVVQTMLDYDTGMIARLVKSCGIDMVNVYTNAAPWPFLLVMLRMWKGVGYGSIVYLSAIANIDTEMYEAAEVDGEESGNGVLLEVGDILDLYIYRAMAGNANLGYGAAAGLYQSVLCFVTILLANYIVKKVQPDYTLF